MTSAGGKLARDSFWMVLVQVFGKSLALSFSLYAAHVLGVEKFGIYGYAMAIITIVAAFSDFGANTYQIRQTAVTATNEERRRLLSESLAVRVSLAAIGFLAILLISGTMSGRETVSLLLILFGLGMFFNNISGAFSYTLIGLENFLLYGMIAIFSQAINIGAASLLVFLGLGLRGIGYAFSAWGFISLVLISLIVSSRHYSPLFRLSRDRIYAFFKGAAPIGLTAILATIYYKSDYVILQYFKGDGQVGLYNAAYAVINALIFLPTTVSITFLPRLTFLKENDPEKMAVIYRYIFKYLLFMGFGLGFGTIAVSRDLIAAIYPDDFITAYLALNILIWALALIFINSLQGNMLVALGRQKLLPYITGSAAVVNIALNFLVIPRYGMQGAAFTTVAAEIVAGGSCLYILRKNNAARHIMPVAAKTLIAGIGMYLFLGPLQGLTLFVRIPAGVIIYFIILVILRGLTKTDLGPIREMLRRG